MQNVSIVGAGTMGNGIAHLFAQKGFTVQLIDTQELEDHAEISIQFACSVRYVTNTPVSHGTGTTITLRLGPDCGTQFSSLPPESVFIALANCG